MVEKRRGKRGESDTRGCEGRFRQGSLLAYFADRKHRKK